jgi:hypothetical protein
VASAVVTAARSAHVAACAAPATAHAAAPNTADLEKERRNVMKKASLIVDDEPFTVKPVRPASRRAARSVHASLRGKRSEGM